MADIGEVLGALEFREVSPDRYVAHNLPTPGQVVYGGQILAQTIVAAARSAGGKDVRSVHTVFARGGRLTDDLEITVDPLNDGRTVGSSTVTVTQGDRVVSRSLVMTSVEEPDLVRHSDAAPSVPAPDDCPVPSRESGWWELRIVDGVNLADADAVGPAELNVWTRAVGAPDDPVVGQALLAYATDGFLIGTAMRPHAGVGQSQAHREVSTSVLTHTLTFHDPIRVADWHLLAHESTFAGRGRAFGRAEVFTTDGAMVASFVQESMLRANPAWDPASGETAKY